MGCFASPDLAGAQVGGSGRYFNPLGVVLSLALARPLFSYGCASACHGVIFRPISSSTIPITSKDNAETERRQKRWFHHNPSPKPTSLPNPNPKSHKMSNYQRVPQDPYPPPGYGSPYPPPPQGYPVTQLPPGYPSAPPPPGYEGYPPPLPPGYSPNYPPPPRPQYQSYQGYFNDGYPPPPPPPPPNYHCHHVQHHCHDHNDNSGFGSFFQGCLTALCCCCLLDECCF